MSDKRSMGTVMEVGLLKMAYVLVATLFVLSCASAQVSGGGVLTLDEALQLAKSNNRDLKQFGFEVGKQTRSIGRGQDAFVSSVRHFRACGPVACAARFHNQQRAVRYFPRHRADPGV